MKRGSNAWSRSFRRISSSISHNASLMRFRLARSAEMSVPEAGSRSHNALSNASSSRTLDSLAASVMRSDLISRIVILSISSPKETGAEIRLISWRAQKNYAQPNNNTAFTHLFLATHVRFPKVQLWCRNAARKCGVPDEDSHGADLAWPAWRNRQANRPVAGGTRDAVLPLQECRRGSDAGVSGGRPGADRSGQ